MDKKTHRQNADAFRQRLKSADWDQAIMSAVDTTRKQRHKTRVKLVAAFSLLLIASFSIGAALIVEENASQQMYTMIEQLATDNFAGPFFE
ncbi:MAG: hypothetical protein U1F27_16885 [Turneriella sp.]